jgi:hypothetical protein
MPAISQLSAVVNHFISGITNGPNDSRMATEVTAYLSSLPILCADAETIATATDALKDFCVRSNGLALGAYMQGFYDVAFDITTNQKSLLSLIDDPVARICEIDAQMNLIRLSRATINPDRLALESAEMEHIIQNCKSLDPSVLPISDAHLLEESKFLIVAETSASLERAKLAWILGDIKESEQIAMPHIMISATAMEIYIRGLLDQSRITEVIQLAFKYVGSYPWLKAYAAIALLRGGAVAQAKKVIDASMDIHFLPMMRVAIEMLLRDFLDDCRSFVLNLLMHQLSSGEEMPALLAASFCLANDIMLPDVFADQIALISQRSQHFPIVMLYQLVEYSKVPGKLCSGWNDIIHPSSVRSIASLLSGAGHGADHADAQSGLSTRILNAYNQLIEASGELLAVSQATSKRTYCR